MRKYTITYREVTEPITEPVTKFGGQPVWIEEPQWPLSREYGTPMQFICQIALPSDLFGDLGARMAYLFKTDDLQYDGPFPATFDPEGGENALVLQPGEVWAGPSLPLREGPSLYRRSHRSGRWEQTPCEFAVELRPGVDLDAEAWDVYPHDKDANNAYWAAILEDKVGGIPVPTPFGPRFSSDLDEWRLLLQLNAKDNAGNGDPFFLNLSYDGVGYAFLTSDGRRGKFLWSR